MAKLYPPNIEGTLPAFYSSVLTVPFSMNRAVSQSEVNGFAIKIKKVNDNSLLFSGEEKTDFTIGNECSVSFDLGDTELNIGEFYKVQIAYINTETSSNLATTDVVGYYSTVGIVKYTTLPIVKIEGMSSSHINIHNYQYVGVYQQAKSESGILKYLDTTEKIYSSEFKLLDSENNIVKTSGEIIHDTSKDIERYQSTETFSISSDLSLDMSYYLVYSVKTINGLEVSSPRYRVMQRRRIPMALNVNFKASLDYENGAIKLFMVSPKFQIASGSFLISRASSKDGYSWENFKYFNLQSEDPEKRYFMDYTVEQGVTYRYSIQQFNVNGVYSDREISNDIIADFEDLFLYDGDRQLRVRFNPKVASFKKDLAETKTETIGSKYPFIFRNGKVNYKEFSISGLISYRMNDTETFGVLKDIGITNDIDSITSNHFTNSLVSYNIAAERQFKLEVLEWLTNGEPKIFRSPSEGNYIVRLMNVSMSPTDTLGRMLHTFTCTAYEIAAFTYENLNAYNLIHIAAEAKMVMRWKTISLRDQYNNKNKSWIKVNHALVYQIDFTEMMPGQRFGIKKYSNSVLEEFRIGATGSYHLDVKSPIYGVYLKPNECTQGLFTFGYKTQASNNFENIYDMESQDVPCQQFIGNQIINGDLSKNFLFQLGDVRTAVLVYYYIRFIKRDLPPIFLDIADVGYKKNFTSEDLNKVTWFYWDGEKNSKVNKADLLAHNSWEIFEIRFCRTETTYIDVNGELYYVDRNGERFSPKTGWVFDVANNKINRQLSNFYDVKISSDKGNQEDPKFQNKIERLSLEEIEHFELDSSFEPTFISFGQGIICEVGYQTQITEYSFETTNTAVKDAKTAWQNALTAFQAQRDNGNLNPDPNLLITVKNKYANFIQELTQAINAYNAEKKVD